MGFYTDWHVTRADGSPVYDYGMSSFSCRDGAFYTMSRGVKERFENAHGIPKMTYSGDYTAMDIVNNAWKLWVLTSEQPLTYSGSFIQGTYNEAQSDFMRDYAIPHAISKLVNKYPTVRFEQIAEQIRVGFDSTARTLNGIRVTGDWSVIPAFYWSGLLQRYSLPYDPAQKLVEWKDVTTLLLNRDSEHKQAWDRLRAGSEPSARYMLAFQSGPISMYQSHVNEETYVDSLIRGRDTALKSHRAWFDFKEI